MAGSSAMHFGRAAYRSGMVRRRQLAAWGLDHLRFRLRGSTDESTQAVLALVKDLLEGVPEKDVARMAPDLLAGILPRIYPQMMDEVHLHQDAGRPAFIVSAASNPLVELLAEVLGFEGGIGTRYEVAADGTLTGDIEGPFIYGEGKVEAMQRFAEEHEIDIGQSWAYSDSASDLPMLRAVGNPVAVNPDATLARIAREEGWEVLRFERLGRRLVVAGSLVAAATLGGLGSLALGRRKPVPPPRRIPPRRPLRRRR
jgi:HAD superfamily hydrolase (TIGR01490 family)